MGRLRAQRRRSRRGRRRTPSRADSSTRAHGSAAWHFLFPLSPPESSFVICFYLIEFHFLLFLCSRFSWLNYIPYLFIPWNRLTLFSTVFVFTFVSFYAGVIFWIIFYLLIYYYLSVSHQFLNICSCRCTERDRASSWARSNKSVTSLIMQNVAWPLVMPLGHALC